MVQQFPLSCPFSELGGSFEEWNSLSLVKIAMSPLTILRTLMTHHPESLSQDQATLSEDNMYII